MVYCCGLALLPGRSFWLDEVIHLVGSRDRTFEQIPAYAAQNAGGVPLGYVYTRASIATLGYSVFSARLPSILFSAGACAAVFVLASRLGLRFPLLAVLLFSLLPLQMRYALEVRPYSAVLCLAGWSTVAFLWLLERASFARTVLYFGLILIGLYTQPYTFFVPLAHLAWLAIERKRFTPQTLILAGSAVVLSAILFLPWLQFAASQWRAEIATYSARGGFGIKEAQLIVKEMFGLGYVGTLLILIPAWFGWRTLAPERRSFWILLFAVPIAGAIAGNLAFGYFFASRQFIVVLLPLAVLASLGFEHFPRRAAASIWAIALLAASMYEDVHAFRRPREDWQTTTAALEKIASEKHACVLPIPARSLFIYRYYRPDFPKLICPTDAAGSIVLALSPYESAVEYEAAKERLRSGGWRTESEQSFQGPKVILFSHAAGK